MKTCKYCGEIMLPDYETNFSDHNRYKALHVCPKCNAVCEEDVTKKGMEVIIHSRRWWNPEAKAFEAEK